jgi:DNA-binding GntR family transcriptional regulator
MSRPVDLGEADPRPYIRMAARLRRQILAGEIAPGQPVPSLATLSREFGHARMTCGKAMRLLEQEGLLTFIPGLGYHTASVAEALLRDARYERLRQRRDRKHQLGMSRGRASVLDRLSPRRVTAPGS